jgi:hypothetical protein
MVDLSGRVRNTSGGAAIMIPREFDVGRVRSTLSRLGWCGVWVIPLVSLSIPVRGDEPPKAADDKAKVQSKFEFKSRKAGFEGLNAGLIVGDRLFINGGPDSDHRAIWHFDTFPKGWESPPGDVVTVRVTFSTFVLTEKAQKEAVDKGIKLSIRAVSRACPQEPPNLQVKGEWQWADTTPDARGKTARERYEAEAAVFRKNKADPEQARPGTDLWKVANELAEKYGYCEIRQSVPTLDSGRIRLVALLLQSPTPPNIFHLIETTRQARTLGLYSDLFCAWDVSVFADIDLPAGVVRSAMKSPDAEGKPKRPRLSLYVKCETEGLLLGMSGPDLKLVDPRVPKQ